jgi:hypothetical protein
MDLEKLSLDDLLNQIEYNDGVDIATVHEEIKKRAGVVNLSNVVRQSPPWAHLTEKYKTEEGAYTDFAAFLEWFKEQDSDNTFDEIIVTDKAILYGIFCKCYPKYF